MFRKLKDYRIEIISTAVILVNALIITKDVKQIREMKRNPKVVIFK